MNPTKEDVRAIQEILSFIGADPGPVDGIWGEQTRRGTLEALRMARGIDATKINDAALSLIKEFEGFRAEAYRDSVGVVTIGYGTTAAAGVGIAPEMGMTITEAEAEEYLMRAVEKFVAEIRPAMTREPTPNELGAMVSLAYNIGPAAFKRSTLLRMFNAGDRMGAADAFMMWDKAGGKTLRGLQRRRAAERGLFLS